MFAVATSCALARRRGRATLGRLREAPANEARAPSGAPYRPRDPCLRGRAPAGEARALQNGKAAAGETGRPYSQVKSYSASRKVVWRPTALTLRPPIISMAAETTPQWKGGTRKSRWNTMWQWVGDGQSTVRSP